MLTTHPLPSGAILELQTASWGSVARLRRAVASEGRQVQLNISSDLLVAMLAKDKNMVAKSMQGMDVNNLKDIVFQLLGSAELEAAVFECMGKCALDLGGGKKERITPASFEPEERRQDFYPAAVEVMRHNLLPFTSGLNFGSKEKGATPPATPA